ncbi:hypothetical protein DFH08DRAFT_971879 [Mycena albidolilacea]|uniref:Ribonuclease H1 N-terminal domain-containing protein n=1 Tax=Mycena albidolilacea TaxID=1033008 RepID=A0AAD7EFF0_9AGAR|nr:hypothetical protein DFH08DRAFT_971879 [Mycena albidolilacea]
MSSAYQACAPVYYPNPGQEDPRERSVTAGQLFYTVGIGYVPGIYTDEGLARDQVSGFSDARWKKSFTYEGAVAIWNDMCERYHDHDASPPASPSPMPSPPPQVNPQDTEPSHGTGTRRADITFTKDPGITTPPCRFARIDLLTDKNSGRAPQPATPCIELKFWIHATSPSRTSRVAPQAGTLEGGGNSVGD